jgi:hypothetical protein
MILSRTQVYTPPYIAEYLVDQTLGQYLANKTVGQIQTLRCLEPACGDGVFLTAMFDRLAKFYQAEQQRIKIALKTKTDLPLEKHQELESTLALTEKFPVRIINQHLYGIDLNSQAVTEAKNQLLAKALSSKTANFNFAEITPNIVHGNFLLESTKIPAVNFNQPEKDIAFLKTLYPLDWSQAFPHVAGEGGFDIVLGNPPYLGFNDYSGAEKAYFQRWYASVYNLKNDLLYYFFYRPAEMVKPGAKLGYIVSRFWKEAAFAGSLRAWLAKHTTLEQLIDLGKLQAFENASIDTCLVALSFNPPLPEHQFSYHYFGNPHTDFAGDSDIIKPGLKLNESWQKLSQQKLGSSAWKFHHTTYGDIVSKLRDMSIALGEICDCKTGVQTGNDRVFLPDNPQVLEGIEPEVLKPAIKNSHISRYALTPSVLRLIYTDKKLHAENYPKLLGYLKPHRAELEKRNRYSKTGTFPYYQLQWAREAEIFEAQEKLICPYKAPYNIFALDTGKHFFSTDVIAVVPKPDCPYSPLALLAMLNSKAATFYFRSYGKPMGGGQYDYYANPVKKLPILRPPSQILPDCDQTNLQLLQNLALNQNWDKLKNQISRLIPQFSLNSLLSFLAETARQTVKVQEHFLPLLNVIDHVIYHLYDLKDDEIEVIETYCPYK